MAVTRFYPVYEETSTNHVYVGENTMTSPDNVTVVFYSSDAISEFGASTYDAWADASKTVDTVGFGCAVVAFVFNCSNIWALVYSKFHHKTTYRLLISLAVANAVIAFIYSLSVICESGCSNFATKINNMVVFNIYQIGSMACAFTYTAISVDLFAQIILPFKYRSMKGGLKRALIVIWIVPVAFK